MKNLLLIAFILLGLLLLCQGEHTCTYNSDGSPRTYCPDNYNCCGEMNAYGEWICCGKVI